MPNDIRAAEEVENDVYAALYGDHDGANVNNQQQHDTDVAHGVEAEQSSAGNCRPMGMLTNTLSTYGQDCIMLGPIATAWQCWRPHDCCALTWLSGSGYSHAHA